MEAVAAGADEHTLVIRNWRTGAQRRVDVGDGVQSADMRADGTAVVGFDGGGVFDADERDVLWTADHCLLVADLTAPAAEAPAPGVCARTELEIDPHTVTLPVRRGWTTLAARAVLVDPDGRRTIVGRATARW